MNKEEIRILSYLSDNLGSGGSITNMLKGINKRYGAAYYPNIYDAVMRLEKKGIISIKPEGKSRIIRLDKGNPFSVYYMSEIENLKTQGTRLGEEMLEGLLELGKSFDIISMCAMEPEKHIKINRIELLILARTQSNADKLLRSILGIEAMQNTRIDPLILTESEFAGIMKNGELSPIKDLILDREVLYNSEGFWEVIRKHGIDSGYERLGRFPHDIPRGELAYNYTRFGYRLQESIKPLAKISLEATIFSMSINGETRIKYGAFVLMHKNLGRMNWPCLYYLYKRYDELGKLKGMLASLNELGYAKGEKSIETLIGAMADAKGEFYESKIIKKYIELYG